MEPCGEVGVMMNLGGENTRNEILKSLLTSSKMQKTEPVEVSILSDLEPTTAQSGEQIVFQIELGDSIKSEFMQRKENIIQHIPVTYLTTDNESSTRASNGAVGEQLTYVLSRDMLPDTTRYCTVGNSEPQKILFFQEIDSNGPELPYNNPDMKSYAAKESQTGDYPNPSLGEVDRSSITGPKHEGDEKLKENNKRKTDNSCRKPGKKDKEESAGGKLKVEKKISTKKKPLNKRKNSKIKSKLKTGGKALLKKSKKPVKSLEEKSEGGEKERGNLFELTKLEDNVDQVAERLKIGCECSDSNCFDGLKPDDVFKHRLNIADLTKAEHDMYLMGVIMASIHNLEETCRHKERIRIRSCYAYQGKKVCLTAFLYLQHVTLYQMKRLRSHLKNHGVSPRIHGNRGRKPANTFSLDIYRRATSFVQKFIEEHCVKTVPNFTSLSPNESKGAGKKKMKTGSKMTSYHLPAECTKRIVHGEYKSFCESLKPSQKLMKYSTFTSFLKKQFPNVKFLKKEDKKQERVVVVKVEDTERWKHTSEDVERKHGEEQGVDKCIQVDKTLVYVPTKTQILINGERLEMYDESGAANPNAMGGQNSEQYYAVDKNA